MSDSETTVTADPGQANGKTDAKPKTARPTAGKTATEERPPVFSAQTGELNDKPCEDCGEPGKAAAGLGLLICGVAGGLLYIGLDLVTGGWFSRKVAGRTEEDGS